MATATELGYLAGIIDGEGCIRVKRGLPSIYVKMTDLDVLENCQRITGVGIVRPVKGVPEHCKPQWVWAVSQQATAASVLMTIFPLMSERRKQKIEGALKTWRAKTLPSARSACGVSSAGYYKHRRNNEEPCDLCKQARIAYDRLRTGR